MNVEKTSTPLGILEVPCTVSATFGGGIADYIGFNFQDAYKIVCPMEGFRHELILHVDGQGRYVLLRDRKPVRPVAFEGVNWTPVRLPEHLEPRLSIWNIDRFVVTSQVFLWQGSGAARQEPATAAKYSVIVVCTRYARRLQAALACLAHQEGFELGQIEVVVCYVPGLDAVDDVLESIHYAHPQLRIVRHIFPEERARAKGHMINAALRVAAGEWVVLLDADTLVPPDLFAKADAVAAGKHFIAPDGRKMLGKEATAAILLGECRPWEEWDRLLRGPGEYRRREAAGIPIGFCQFVRADCAREVRYLEVNHFEFSDMQFGRDLRARFGPETWLNGTPVLHLDHGGSHWYGTASHR